MKKGRSATTLLPVRGRWKTRAVLFLSLIVVIALYWHTLDNPLVFDSATTLTDNFLSHGMYEFTPRGEGYHRWLSHQTFFFIHDYIADNLAYQHGLNILLHVLNTILMFVFFRLLTAEDAAGPEMAEDERLWIPVFAAAFFGLNPVSTYATAYLIQRSILMAVFFCLLSLSTFTLWLKRRSPVMIVSAVLFYLCAFVSKEHCAPFAGVILLILLLHRRDDVTPASPKSVIMMLRRFWPVLPLAGVCVVIFLQYLGTFTALGEPHGKVIIRLMEGGADLSDGQLYLLSVMTQGYLFFRYILLWFIPYLPWISIDIHLPFPLHFLSWPETAGFAFFIASGIAAFVALLRARDYLGRLCAFGILSSMVLFTAEFSVTRLSEQFVLYRSYLWMITPFACVPALVRSASEAWKPFGKIWKPAFFIYLALLAFLTHDRLLTFDSRAAIWEDTIKKISGDDRLMTKTYRTYNNYGHALTLDGRMDEAIYYFRKSAQINPYYTKAYSNLGAVYTSQGRYDEAQVAYQKALQLEPTFVDALIGMGVVNAEKERYEEALEYYARAFKQDPAKEDAYYNSGNAYLLTRRFTEAEAMYKKAISINAKLAEAYLNLSITYQYMNRPRDVELYRNKAVELKPSLADAARPSAGTNQRTVVRSEN